VTAREPSETTNLSLARYANETIPWDRAEDALVSIPPSEDLTWFLGTVRPDGRPHAAGVGALYLDGAIWFTSSPAARKSRNLARNPRCTFSVRLKGIDLVFEGVAERATDGPTLQQFAARARDGGWPAEVEGDALTAPYSAPSAGPPPWHLYRFRVATVFGVATAEPYGATRWRFA
jgi:hypothetical protein